MRKVYSIADNIFSPLGFTTQANWNQLHQNISGVVPYRSAQEVLNYCYAAVIEEVTISDKYAELSHTIAGSSKLEKMFIASIAEALSQVEIDVSSARTLFIFSTTKGNIDLLEKNKDLGTQRLRLFDMAMYVTHYFKNTNTPMVISNACISGVLAIEVATTLLKRRLYDHVIVVGGDLVSQFTVSGFHSFQALSYTICKPFDKDRAGINLGEAAATMILSSQQNSKNDIEIMAGATSNDANHISGPSRTGEGMARAIYKTMNQADVAAKDIQYVLAHGTATMYNDEMEAKALENNNLSHVPTNSLKAYYGHTLGAAGVVETIIAMKSMKENTILKSLGYSECGVSTGLNVAAENLNTIINFAMKTASGFGGCNAALILKK